MQYEKHDCPDFEIRFCCNKNLEIDDLTASGASLSYSESDLEDGKLTISYEFKVTSTYYSYPLKIKLRKVPKLVMRHLLALSVNLEMSMIAMMGPMKVCLRNAKGF